MFTGLETVLSDGATAVTAVATAALGIGVLILLFKTARRMF